MPNTIKQQYGIWDRSMEDWWDPDSAYWLSFKTKDKYQLLKEEPVFYSRKKAQKLLDLLEDDELRLQKKGTVKQVLARLKKIRQAIDAATTHGIWDTTYNHWLCCGDLDDYITDLPSALIEKYQLHDDCKIIMSLEDITQCYKHIILHNEELIEDISIQPKTLTKTQAIKHFKEMEVRKTWAMKYL